MLIQCTGTFQCLISFIIFTLSFIFLTWLKQVFLWSFCSHQDWHSISVQARIYILFKSLVQVSILGNGKHFNGRLSETFFGMVYRIGLHTFLMQIVLIFCCCNFDLWKYTFCILVNLVLHFILALIGLYLCC